MSIFTKVWNAIKPPPLKQGIANIKSGFENVKRIAMTPIKVPPILNPRNLWYNAVTATALPVTNVAGTGIKIGEKVVSGLGKGLKAGVGAIKNEWQKPLMPIGKGISGFLSNLGTKAAKGAGAAIAGGIAYNAITGKPIYDINNILKGAELGLAVGISPISAIVGAAGGTGSVVLSKAESQGVSSASDIEAIFNKLRNEEINFMQNLPNQTPQNISITYPDLSGLSNMTMPSYSGMTPMNMSMPSFSPSVSMQTGGGMSEILPLLLALGGGLGAFAYYKHRKKKKRKYKKRKKY